MTYPIIAFQLYMCKVVQTLPLRADTESDPRCGKEWNGAGLRDYTSVYLATSRVRVRAGSGYIAK